MEPAAQLCPPAPTTPLCHTGSSFTSLSRRARGTPQSAILCNASSTPAPRASAGRHADPEEDPSHLPRLDVVAWDMSIIGRMRAGLRAGWAQGDDPGAVLEGVCLLYHPSLAIARAAPVRPAVSGVAWCVVCGRKGQGGCVC